MALNPIMEKKLDFQYAKEQLTESTNEHLGEDFSTNGTSMKKHHFQASAPFHLVWRTVNLPKAVRYTTYSFQ